MREMGAVSCILPVLFLLRLGVIHCDSSLAAADYVLEQKAECHYHNGTQRVRYLDRYFYNQEEIVYFDSDVGRYVARTELGRPDADAWNRDMELIEQKRHRVETFCKPNYEGFQTIQAIGKRDKTLHPASSVGPGNVSQETFVLNLTAIPPSVQGSQLLDTFALLRTTPTQGTPTPAAFSSPTTPQPPPIQEQIFWQNWQALQQHIIQSLDTQNRHLNKLSHLPRRSRNMSRNTTELTRLNNKLELFREENSRILEAIQQQNTILLRHQQNFNQAFQYSQETMNSNMQALTTALRDISGVITHMSQQLSQIQPPTSASTSASITPSQTPTSSPQ